MININLYIKRKENNMYQKQVAEKLAMHPQTYHEKEKGKKEFTLSECKMLAKLFDCTLNDLFWEGEQE